MKKTGVLTALVLGLIFLSCKKERTCECKNGNGTYIAGQTEATKSQGKKYCKSLSTSSTECYLK